MNNKSFKQAPKKGGRKPGSKNQTKKPVDFSAEKIYTVSQTAAILQVDERTVLNYIKTGALKASDTSAGFRIKGIWIDEFLNQSVFVH
jgi:hypothetical protein